jgi:hypothetical protein
MTDVVRRDTAPVVEIVTEKGMEGEYKYYYIGFYPGQGYLGRQQTSVRQEKHKIQQGTGIFFFFCKIVLWHKMLRMIYFLVNIDVCQ